MYAENLAVRRLGPNYLVITGYVGTVKKMLPVEAATLRKLQTDIEYALANEEHNTNGYSEPPKRGRKPRASEMPSTPFYGADGELLPNF